MTDQPGDGARQKSTKTETIEETGLHVEGALLALLTIAMPGQQASKFPITNMHRKLFLGRDPTADIHLDDKAVSRQHAIITRDRDKFYIEDLHSKNGTVLNGKFLRGGRPTRLAHGDEVFIGRIRIFFESNLPKGAASDPSLLATPEATPKHLAVVPTGYEELDSRLGGGIPERYAVILLSPSCDERDLLLGKMVESSIHSDKPTFYVSSDLSKTAQFVQKYEKGFHVFSPYASQMGGSSLLTLPRFEDLSGLNISISNGINSLRLDANKGKFMVIEIIADVLLLHKLSVTRRWLSDFIARRKAQGFTLVATFNPNAASESEAEVIVDVFDGVLSMTEKDADSGPSMFLTIKKLLGRKYPPEPIRLDKRKLF